MNNEHKYRINKIKDIETPVNIILTNDLQPEFINLELLRKIESKFILNCPLLEVYNHLDVFEKAKKFFLKDGKTESGKSYINKLCDFDNSYRYLNIRNVLKDDFFLNINKNITIKYNKSSVVFTLDDFFKCIKLFEPDIICIPSEEIKIDEEVGKKKKIRIIKLMNEFLEKIEILKNENKINNGNSFLCILSIPSTININKLLIDTLKKYDEIIDGYLLSGLGYTESNEVRTSYITNILSILPKNKLKFIQLNTGNVIEILHSVYYGIDVIESNLPYYLARNGKALNITIDMDKLTTPTTTTTTATALTTTTTTATALTTTTTTTTTTALTTTTTTPTTALTTTTTTTTPTSSNNELTHDINKISFTNQSDIFIIDLNDKKYVHDHSKITSNSPRDETRSYIHHLLKCKELSANVLLTYHNLYLYKLFFQEIQKQIKNNNFLIYVDRFIEHHKCHIKHDL
ncbi:queuine tRNA-ribosyltransferase, putative [Hepatocystis sp. ex Piliocolobus tephrosceles]|nr:queuine tRNA-ribosyltransferase, putative [Hepatocystis sp. ex Piliocolobus tephrosceles]